MNKRTKRKIHNRIMKKILNGKPLSKFDKKYLSVLFKPEIEKMKRHVVEAFVSNKGKGKPVGLLNEIRKEETETMEVKKAADSMRRYDFIDEDYSWPQSAYEDLLEVGRGKSNYKHAQEDAFDSLRYAAEYKHESPAVEEPSKWQQIKGKAKGWFGK